MAKKNVYLIGSAIALALLCETSFAQTPAIEPGAKEKAAEVDPEAQSLEGIVVIGSRGKPRTDVERPVPVDVVNAKDLASTGQTDLGQQIQFTSPSFNSNKNGVNGAANYADPASLRGLGPDQVLVLVNGKRRHQFSALNLNVAPGKGTVVTDLNSIPSSAIQRIEVLRDGAAAQYGSDAIAGIINLVLNDGSDGGTVSTTAGIHKEGDGETYKVSLNHGVPLGGKGGYFNYSLEWFQFDGTNRSDPFTGALYPATPTTYATTGPTPAFPYTTANPRADRGVYPQAPFVVGNYGANRNRTYQAFVNSSVPVAEIASLYVFGGFSRKEITAFGFFRSAATAAESSLGIYPDGYLPEIPGVSTDYSVVGGAKTELDSGWKFDASVSYGKNRLDQNNNNTVNPSLGNASPTSFYLGRTSFGQVVVDLNGSKSFEGLAGLQAVSVAFGGQYRRDSFRAQRGDLASYVQGPVLGKNIGAAGRPGISDRDENSVNRSNFAAFVDVEADISEALLVAAALRYENYSDFGGNISGKIAARFKLNDSIAVRGSYNRGFRAPSIAQTANRVLTSTAQNNVVVQTQQVSSDDPRLATLGVPQPKAEISDDFGAGITAQFPEVLGGRLTATLDIYQINIKDRIAITQGLRTADFPAIRALFPSAREIGFFTNQIDTRTRGIDFVTTYKRSFGGDVELDLSIAASHNSTKVKGQKETPAPILAGATATGLSLQLLDQTSIELIEVAVPKTKVLINAKVEVGRFSVNARGTYFGSVKAFSAGLSPSESNVSCVGTRCVQTFKGKPVFDMSLGYKATDDVSVTVGANNIFNTYPDKWNNTAGGSVGQAAAYSNGQIPYSRNSNQFSFNGAYYYASVSVKF
jgi:iron complex outermembrane recepter protein